jgi:serine/threonine protein kinase
MQKIGRYQILKELGRGAMGVVYAASDPNIGRTVAIKTIRISDFDGTPGRQELRDRLQREAQAAGILSHPGIVTIHDVGEEGNSAYIVMEFIDGRTMEDVLSSGVPQPSHTLIRVLMQTAEALDYAHGKGIVHRDMKPSNLIVCSDGRVKIADFGIARIASSTSLTQTGFVLGTPDYMSPEQAQARPVDGRADQFSLAVIACRMLTGKLPFYGPTLTAVLTKILWEEPQYLNTNLSPGVQKVLRKALAKNPNQRYATCVEFAEDLQHAYLASRQEAANLAAAEPEVLPTAPKDIGPVVEKAEARTSPGISGSRRIAQTAPIPLVESASSVHDLGYETQSEAYSDSNGLPPNRVPNPEPQSLPALEAPRKSRGVVMMAASVAILGLLAVSLLYWRHARTAQASAPVQLPIQTAAIVNPPQEPVLKPVLPGPESQPVQQNVPPIPKPEISKSTTPAAKKPTITKKADLPPSTSAPLKSAKIPEVIVKPVAAPPPVEPEIRTLPTKKVLESGVITWAGRLNKNSVLVISDQQASVGALSGKLPGVPVTIEIDPQSVLVRVAPSVQNNWKQLILSSGDQKLTSITIHWTAVQ